MKKFNILFALILSLPFLFNACSSENTAETGAGAVNLLCDCFLEAEIENEYDLMDLDHDEDKAKDVVKCVLPILKDVQSELDDMKDEEREQYFGDAIKAAVDCDCGIKLLEIAAKMYDYDEVEDEFDDLIDELEWFLEYAYDDYYYETEEAYEDYYYDDYEYEDEYYPEEIDEGNGYELVVQMMDAIYYEDIQLNYSTMYDVEMILDAYSDDYDYISINKYFDGYSYDAEFYFEDGELSSISCNTFYDSGWEYEAKVDSEEVLEYLIDLFGAPDSEGGDYNDWTYNGQEISFNIFEDGYSLYVDPPYDYEY